MRIEWQLGEDDGSSGEFGQESFVPEAAPGNATAKDDHYYFSGSYPQPIGVVANNEPLANFERALTLSDPSVSIHFELSAADVAAANWVRITLDFGNSAQGSNIIDLAINPTPGSANVVYTTPSFYRFRHFSTTLAIPASHLQAGANRLVINRNAQTTTGWVTFDFVGLEIDENPQLDLDGDGLTSAQEYALGSSVNAVDTDGDGLNDGDEIQTNPILADTDGDGLDDGQETTTSPILADSDGDGAADGWEVTTGYDPTSASSTPPVFDAAIGINFISEGAPDTFWGRQQPTGLIPQENWNHSTSLPQWGLGDSSGLRSLNQSVIAMPQAGVVQDAAGQATGLGFTALYDGCRTSHNTLTREMTLLNGFLQNRENDTRQDAAELELTGIPFSNYDVYVYVAGNFTGARATLEHSGQSSTRQAVLTQANAPYQAFIEATPRSGFLPPYANVLRYEDLSGSSLSLRMLPFAGACGFSAIQIIDRDADSDGDGLPDAWEVRYGSRYGVANAGADVDGDGLDAAAEYALGSDPTLADTDGDGLSDLVETGTGTYISATQTGSSPNLADSDGDGVDDSREIAAGTDPNATDSDNDGTSDVLELASGTSPTSAAAAIIEAPAGTTDSFVWEVDDIQLVWDHTQTERLSRFPSQDIALLRVDNASDSSRTALQMGLYLRHGTLTYFFYSRRTGAFHSASQPNNDIFRSDWAGSTDLSAACGFSGFGKCDISDRLSYRIEATRNPSTNRWQLIYTIRNQTQNTVVHTFTLDDLTAAPTVADGSAIWENDRGVDGQGFISKHPGVEVFFDPVPLESKAPHDACADLDNDGMFDTWETANNLASPTADADADGLNNREEFLLGTNPNSNDSDGDGQLDGLELASFTNALDGNSTARFLETFPASGGDLNADGLPDLWAALHGVTLTTQDLDWDGDGVSNRAEALAGTDPRDATSRLYLRSEEVAGDQLLCWPVLADKSDALQVSTTLSGFVPSGLTPVLVDGERRVTLTADETREFFRVAVDDKDSDNDGVTDWDERRLGLDLNAANSAGAAYPHDGNGDGTLDSTVPSDLVAFADRVAPPVLNGGNALSAHAASRFLLQATFGPTLPDIRELQHMGISAWLDDQIHGQPATFHSKYFEEIQADFDGPRVLIDQYSFNDLSQFINGNNIQTSFGRAAIQGEDQLRQRVAFALSQILVVSRRDAAFENRPAALTSYYDLLVEHAFGDFTELLMAVTMHPTMGRYLSAVGNQQADAAIGRFPDENYAREIMQLFTIGLWELNADGTRKLDGSGNPIPTYDNEDITEMARVMTGLWYGQQPWGGGGWHWSHYLVPMEMHADRHDFGAKTLPDGTVLPERVANRENALAELREVINWLVEHPNAAPFISKALIQFLITDNPAPDYVARVAAVFANDGTGKRGNLEAVVRAILLDDEARRPRYNGNSRDFGRLREPVLRATHLARLTKLDRFDGLLWWDWGDFEDASAQSPQTAPTVFNFYRPDYVAPGVLDQNNLTGGVFEITNSFTAISFPNELWDIASDGFQQYRAYSFAPSYEDFLPFTNDIDQLLAYVNLVAAGNRLSAETIGEIRTVLQNMPDENGRTAINRARYALYLAIMSPDVAVQQ